MDAQLCEYVRHHRVVHLKWVNCKVCELYLNKAITKKKKKVTPFFIQKPHAQQEKNLMFGLHSYCAHEQRPLSHPALCLCDPLSLDDNAE